MISTVLKNFLKPLAIASSLVLALNTSSAFAVSVGDKAPDFKIPRLESKGMISLKQYRGKVVYVDFWASWCGPCRQSLPALNSIRKEFRKKGFEVIAINLDEERDDAMEFLKEFPVAFPTARDTSGEVPEAYGLVGMPTAYLIDRKGYVQLVHEGFKKSDIEELKQKISTLLKQK
ncbi:MAG: TlpA family protein disulfide reductase [Oleispira sp.]|nr:TlpA family protein disulfide reductase [Oleispira sp.]MBL4882217.1 TlpA family protein disulfide reductase [Oleispira sp.]